MKAPRAAAICVSPIDGSNRLTARSGLLSSAIRIASSRVIFRTAWPGRGCTWPACTEGVEDVVDVCADAIDDPSMSATTAAVAGAATRLQRQSLTFERSSNNEY